MIHFREGSRSISVHFDLAGNNGEKGNLEGASGRVPVPS